MLHLNDSIDYETDAIKRLAVLKRLAIKIFA